MTENKTIKKASHTSVHETLKNGSQTKELIYTQRTQGND